MRWMRVLAALVALPLAAYVLPAQSATATATITGVVTEADGGQPVPDVGVSVVGTRVGAATDAAGRFTIRVAPGTYRLRAARIGFAATEDSVTVADGGTATVNFALRRVAVTLDEVVAIGYGTQRRTDLTGAVSSVLPATEQTPTTSLEQALLGKAAGVQVTQASSAPGGGITIRIRGGSSITGGNEPLYVIDGIIVENDIEGTSPGDAGRDRTVPFNPLAALNPNDIESIDILKDASSTAIYGARGANGVVLITTRRGSAGTPRVTLDSYAGTQSVAKRYDLLNAREFALFANEWGAQQETPITIFSDEEIAALGTGTDWQDHIFRDAPVRNLQLGISGGTTGDNQTRYAISTGIFDQEGVVVGSDFRRISLRGNLNQSIGRRFRATSNLLLSRVSTSAVPTDGGSNSNAGAVGGALQYYPTIPVRRPDGTYTLLNEDGPSELSPSTVPNPVSMAEDVRDELGDTRVLANLVGEYEILSGLRVRISGAADYAARFRDTYYPRTTLPGRGVDGEARRGETDQLGLLNENTLSYERDFGSAHEFDAVVGYSRQRVSTSRTSILNNTFVSDILTYEDIGAGARPGGPSVSSPHSESRFVSYFGRVNYTLLGRYMFTVTGRRDGSSRFGPQGRWGDFPSAAVAWRVTDEPFLPEIPFLDMLKLRVSWGEAGNPSIRPYQSMTRLATGRYAFGSGGGVVGYYPAVLGNPDLRWETTQEENYGTDVTLWDNRIDLTVDYYRKRTKDLLLSKLLPPHTGFGSILVNTGGVRNTGLELALNLNVLDPGDAGGFGWTTSFNYSHNRNRVLDLGGDTLLFAARAADDIGLNGTVIRPGDPLGVFFGYKVDGILRSDQEAAEYTADVTPPTGTAWQAGQARIVDVNGDGAIDADDRTIIGNPAPRFTVGWTNSLSWRGFELSTLVDGSYGSELLNLNLARLEAGTPRSNILRERWADAWRPDNTDAAYPKVGVGAGFIGSDITSDMLEDGSYTRLRSVTLSFGVPRDFVARSGLSTARVYVTGTNLATWTDYGGFNPDVSSLGVGNVNRGIDVGAYPLAKSVTFGVNLSY